MANLKTPRYNLRSANRSKDENWEEIQCPICQEVPHNAVLLICSNHGIGCRPYMCDTGDSLSNCFSWFCEKHEVEPVSTGYESPNQFVDFGRIRRSFACPLCRGDIEGWVLVKGADRGFMDKMVRSCPLDSCDFSGNYADLKKHVKAVVHDRPSPRIIFPWDQGDDDDDYEEYDENYVYPAYFDSLSPSDFEGTVEPSRPDDETRMQENDG